MAQIQVKCLYCGTDRVKKKGFTDENKQRYHCQHNACGRTFILDYHYRGSEPGIEGTIVDMALNGNGIRDTARVLKVSPFKVISTLKKQAAALDQVNFKLLKKLMLFKDTSVRLERVELEAEADEMWSFVGSKDRQRWLWHAIDHKSGKVLAYVLDSRKDNAFRELKALLKPFGITRYYTDDWGAYGRELPAAIHDIGKRNTQKIERKHLTLRTRIKRLARKTICFSKLKIMHDIVIGLFINRYEFGIPI